MEAILENFRRKASPSIHPQNVYEFNLAIPSIQPIDNIIMAYQYLSIAVAIAAFTVGSSQFAL